METISEKSKQRNSFHSYCTWTYILQHFLFLCHKVFSDVHVSFFHVVPVPILMSPFSIASEHPYTVTLMPLEAISTCVDVSWLTPGCYVIIGKIMKSGLFLSTAGQQHSLLGFPISFRVKGHYRSQAVWQNHIHYWCKVCFSCYQEEMNFEFIFSQFVYEVIKELNPMQNFQKF